MTEFTDLLSQFETDGETPSPDQPKVPILVVDDDPSIRRGLSRVFAYQYDVLTAESGKKGVEALTEAVHCVILDVKMKEQNGFATYPKLKAKSPNVPIIFYTAFQSEHDLQEVINKFKPEGYVDKGQDISFLDNLVANAVHKYRLIIENEAYKSDLEKRVEERTKKLKTALEDLKVTQAKLIQSEQIASTSRLISSLSHRLKNPTVAIERLHPDLSKAVSEFLCEYFPKVISLSLSDEEYAVLIEIGRKLFYSSLQKKLPTTLEVLKRSKDIQRVLIEQGVNISDSTIKQLSKCPLDPHDFVSLRLLLNRPDHEVIIPFLSTISSIGNQLKNTKTSINEISANINKVLNAVRIEKESPTSGVSINNVIDSALELLSHRMVNIEIEKQYGPIAQISCYPVDLMHAFVYIIENAIEAMEGEGKIEIRSETVMAVLNMQLWHRR